MKKFFESEPVIFSTGGGEKGLFQDTINNMRHAIEHGADVIRSNAALTGDGAIVLYSDSVFQNDQIFKPGISSLKTHELREMHKKFMIDIEEGRISEDSSGIFPELSDVLTTLPGQRFNLNFPDTSIETANLACRIIAETGAEHRILASSMNGPVIHRIRSLIPEMPTSFSFPAMVGFYALYRSGFLYFKKRFIADAFVMHEMIGASFLGSPGMIREARERGIRVYFLNIDSAETVRRLRDAGADGFVTNEIEAVKNALI